MQRHKKAMPVKSNLSYSRDPADRSMTQAVGRVDGRAGRDFWNALSVEVASFRYDEVGSIRRHPPTMIQSYP